MTTTATETDLIPVGTRVRIDHAGAEAHGKQGVVNSNDDITCCGGTHQYRVDLDGGGVWLGARRNVVRLDSETPFAVGDRVRLTEFVGGDAQVGDVGTVTEVRGDSMFVKFDGRSFGARGNGEHAVTMRQVENGVLVKDGSQPSEAVDIAVKDQIDDAVRAALASYKERVKSVAMDYARRNDWCSEVTRALEDMDIDMTPDSESIRVTLDITYEPSTTEAEDGVDYAYLAEQAVRTYVDNYCDGSVSIDSSNYEHI